MISSQAELEGTLRKVAELNRAVHETLSTHEGISDVELQIGSLRSVITDMMLEISDYFQFFQYQPDLRFDFKGNTATTATTGINVVGDVLSDFQGLLWDAGERILGFTPRKAGKPAQRVYENCSLMLAFADPHRVVLGLDFIRGDRLFPDVKLRGQALSAVSEVVDDVNRGSLRHLQARHTDARFLSKVKILAKTIAGSFDHAQLFSRDLNNEILEFDLETPKKASDMLMSFSRPVEKTIEGILMVLNFFTHQITVSGEEKVRMYFDPEIIAEDAVANAALRTVRLKGTQLMSNNGTPVEFIPQEMTVLD